MSNLVAEVREWNKAVGKIPAEVDSQTLNKAAELVFEEAQETLDATIDEDLLEILDGVCDVDYTNAYLKVLLEQKGVDVDGAMQAVIENNKLKLKLTYEEASALAEHFDERGEPCYVTKTEGFGELRDCRFAVQRVSDNKVMKPLDHPKVDLTEYLPKEM